MAALTTPGALIQTHPVGPYATQAAPPALHIGQPGARLAFAAGLPAQAPQAESRHGLWSGMWRSQ